MLDDCGDGIGFCGKQQSQFPSTYWSVWYKDDGWKGGSFSEIHLYEPYPHGKDDFQPS
jgi:hypothetical protein